MLPWFCQSLNPLNYAFKPVINRISLPLQEKEFTWAHSQVPGEHEFGEDTMHPNTNTFNNTFSLQFEQEALYFHFALEPTHYVTFLLLEPMLENGAS